MPRIKEITLYQFDELSDKAKDKARDWYRYGFTFDDDGCSLEPAIAAAPLLGIEYDTRRNSKKPAIFYTGFSSQGDGASFEGHYRFNGPSPQLVRAEWPQDKVLHEIADGLAELQAKHDNRIAAVVSRRGRYCHEMTMHLDYCVLASTDTEDETDADEETSEAVLELLRDFARWIYHGLREDYEYQMSDEVVDENIRANEYEFTEEGVRA